ncbi:PAS domain-containing protein [Sulfurimonas sp.]
MLKKSLSKLDAPSKITNSEKTLSKDDFIVSKTDTKGKIIYCNEMFTKLSGYSASDLIGANHNLIRHPDMPKIAFKIVWDKIQVKEEFFGFVKNLCADGGYYWVFTYITPDLDSKGNIISYTSIRRQATQSAVDIIIPIYKQLLDAQRHGGIAASEALLNTLLQEHKLEYNEFIINLQKGAKI